MTTTAKKTRKPPITKWFIHWRELKDQAEVVADRQGDFRDDLVEAVQQFGAKDGEGHYFYELPSPVEFPDHNGRTFKYVTLKAERHLTPSQPTPDPEKAEALLKSKGLWISPQDQKILRDLRTRNPVVSIEVEIDPDAVAKLWYQDELTDAEYEGTLREQKETYQFRPQE